MMEKLRKYLTIIIPYVFAVGICIFLSYTIGYRNLSLDEAFSVKLARMSIKDCVIASANDVHPPLYYIILRFAGFMGKQSLLSYKIISVLPIWLILCYLGAYKLSKQYGFVSSLFFIICFGGAYYTCEEAMNVRMYGWAAFFVLIAFICILEWSESHEKKKIIRAVVFTVCAMYTHYFALLFCFFMWLSWGIRQLIISIKNKDERKYIKKFVICAAIFVVAYIPWLGAVLAQSKKFSENGWLATANFDWTGWWDCLPEIIQLSDYRYGACISIMLIILVVSGIVSGKRGVSEGGIAFVLTMITGALVSIYVSPLWVTRFGYTFWGILPFVAAVSLSTPNSKDAKEKIPYLFVRIVLISAVCINCFITFKYYLKDEAMTVNGKEWYEFAQNELNGQIVLISSPAEHKITFDYYMPGANIIMVPDNQTFEILDIENILNSAKSNGEDVWYVTDPRVCAIDFESIGEKFNSLGYEVCENKTYFIRNKSLFVYKVVPQ